MGPCRNPSKQEWRSCWIIRGQLAVIAAFFVIWSAVYDVINEHWLSAADRAIWFARPCDQFPGVIQPWTAAIYLVGGVALPLVPFFFHWRWAGIRFVLTCHTIAAGITFAVYWAWPVRMDRPVFNGPDVGCRLMRWVQAVDQPANCCPSSHALFAVLGALLVAHGGAETLTRTLTWVLAIAVCATTITTGQHYLIDVAAGGERDMAYAAARLTPPRPVSHREHLTIASDDELDRPRSNRPRWVARNDMVHRGGFVPVDAQRCRRAGNRPRGDCRAALP